jgi:hypothetical protein
MARARARRWTLLTGQPGGGCFIGSVPLGVQRVFILDKISRWKINHRPTQKHTDELVYCSWLMDNRREAMGKEK